MNTASEAIHEIDQAATPDAKRRQWLLAATSVMGGTGLFDLVPEKRTPC